MRYINFLITFLLLSFVCKSQNLDRIIKNSGDTLNVSIQAMNDSTIMYKFPNESFIITINKSHINKIIYASGRLEIFDSPISKKNYISPNDVIITTNPNDVKGLKIVKSIIKKSTVPMSSKGKLFRGVIAEIKKECADMGAHIFLVQTNEYSAWPFTNINVSGNAYSY